MIEVRQKSVVMGVRLEKNMSGQPGVRCFHFRSTHLRHSPLPGFPSYNAGRGSAGAQNCANQENGWWQYFQSIAGEKTYRNLFVLWSHWGPSSLCSTPRDKKGLRQSVYFIHQGKESITCPQQLSSRSMMERKLILYTWG